MERNRTKPQRQRALTRFSASVLRLARLSLSIPIATTPPSASTKVQQSQPASSQSRSAKSRRSIIQLIPQFAWSNQPATLHTSFATFHHSSFFITMLRSNSQSSQNIDNFLREKPSTRLHQPPGGSSSVGNLIYGGGCDESPFANHLRRSSVGRVKEEAPEQVNPYSKDYRRGSNSGGGSDYQHHQQSSSGPYPGYQQPAQHQQHQAPMQQQQYPGYQQQQQQQQQQPYGGGAGRQSSNSYATGSNQNSGNVLTERRITRIHAPPGGNSSITFG